MFSYEATWPATMVDFEPLFFFNAFRSRVFIYASLLKEQQNLFQHYSHSQINRVHALKSDSAIATERRWWK